MFIISSPGRGQAIIGAGYFRQLSGANNSEEVIEAEKIATVVQGNDREFDVWKSIAIQGVAAADLSSTDPATLAAAIVALIPPDIAKDVADEIAKRMAA